MKTLASALLIIGTVLQAGCNADRAATCTHGGDASPSQGCEMIMCSSSNASFPSFDKTCTSADDCAIGIHQTNCCGATLAIGMTKAEQARFAADEKICIDQYPICGCPAIPTITEDGQSAAPGKTIIVECLSNMCMTTVK